MSNMARVWQWWRELSINEQNGLLEKHFPNRDKMNVIQSSFAMGELYQHVHSQPENPWTSDYRETGNTPR